MAKVSVIIPCYNQGAYLDEAVDSVLAQSFDDLEIIIVNDGSTDEFTSRKCASYNDGKIRVIATDNQGLAAARNNGIAVSRGTYILPLDADDLIGAEYIAEAVPVLDAYPDVGIVYCRARLFGAVETDWLLPQFSLEEMMRDNVIFCTALFRKNDWEMVGGYDTGMIYGWEDYEFWLSLIERGRKVHQLPGRHFFYRVSDDSMVRSKEKWQKIEMFKRIYQRHSALIGSHIDVWIDALLETGESYRTSRLYVDCGSGVNDRDSVARKVEPGTRVVRFDIGGFDHRRALRFDPVDCPACLEIHTIALFDGTKQSVCDIAALSSNALYRSENAFMFDSADPQIVLDIDSRMLDRVKLITVEFEFTALAEEALRTIIAYQKSLLAPARKRSFLHKWPFSPRS